MLLLSDFGIIGHCDTFPAQHSTRKPLVLVAMLASISTSWLIDKGGAVALVNQNTSIANDNKR